MMSCVVMNNKLRVASAEVNMRTCLSDSSFTLKPSPMLPWMINWEQWTRFSSSRVFVICSTREGRWKDEKIKAFFVIKSWMRKLLKKFHLQHGWWQCLANSHTTFQDSNYLSTSNKQISEEFQPEKGFIKI